MTREFDYGRQGYSLGTRNSAPSFRERSPLRSVATADGREKWGEIEAADRETTHARVFLRNITPAITCEILRDHFSKWGQVLGVLIVKRGDYGFVQFTNRQEARTCITLGHTNVCGVDIVIRSHVNKADPAAEKFDNLPTYGNNSSEVDYRAARPKYGNGIDTREAPTNAYMDKRLGSDATREIGLTRTSFYDSLYKDSIASRDSELLDRSSRGSTYSSESYDRNSGLKPDYKFSSITYSSNSESDKPNDVEIVVSNKAQRAYAENIEARLKKIDLTVDLLFPPPNLSSENVVRDLTVKKCLYAIFTTPDNEKHNSLTLNILHGNPQEHRNMPVDDAMRLVEQLVNTSDKKKSRQHTMGDIVPREIRNFLLDLLEMRSLSMGELDKVIKYLRERQNTLVDNQIEQKMEETVGQTQAAAVVSRNMTVTYPGYNYIQATGMPNVTATVTHPATPAGMIAAPFQAPNNVSLAYQTATYTTGMQGIQNATAMPANPALQAATVPVMSAPTVLPAAAAMPSVGHPMPTASHMSGANLHATMASGSFGLSQQVVSSQQAHAMAPNAGLLHHQQYPQAVPAPTDSDDKQRELQERILRVLKSQTGGPSSSTAAPQPPPMPPLHEMKPDIVQPWSPATKIFTSSFSRNDMWIPHNQ